MLEECKRWLKSKLMKMKFKTTDSPYKTVSPSAIAYYILNSIMFRSPFAHTLTSPTSSLV